MLIHVSESIFKELSDTVWKYSKLSTAGRAGLFLFCNGGIFNLAFSTSW